LSRIVPELTNSSSPSRQRHLKPYGYLPYTGVAKAANHQVADVKKKIQEAQTFPAENQKLIYSGQLVSSPGIRATLMRFTGKILNDTATVASLNIKEKDFIVCMVSKVSLGMLFF
jgi:hypothetical protein